ncbi:MAG: T9SS type A sorting domain-containing protein, partial [Elusimicrobia bacterium]|nr:T9SS type A sorting domain-containing protein [Elusimicrobiota bacterium]
TTGLSLSSGAYTVRVRRDINNATEESNTVVFTLTIPQVYSLTPSSGPIGVPFTITGQNFGNYASGKTNVLFNNTTAYLSLWTDTKIQGTVPSMDYASGITLSSGNYSVTVKRSYPAGGVSGEVSAAAGEWTMNVPSIESAPSTAAYGGQFTLTGANFGNYISGKTNVLLDEATCYLSLWTDGKIQGKLPGASAGEHALKVRRDINGGLSESMASNITVIYPEISAISPQSGNVGAVFTISGESFGNYENGRTEVLFGNTTAYLTLWNDTQIKGLTPNIISGGYRVKARRKSYDGLMVNSNEADYLVTGGYSTQEIKVKGTEFAAGRIFVAPNPARGGDNPIFHIETGIADSVEIRIYGVGGELVKKHTIIGSPNISSPDYAYRWEWSGAKTSGVYFYTIESRKGSGKIKKQGKFAVIK